MAEEFVRGKATETAIGYCVKCRAKQAVSGPQRVTLKTGRDALRGPCPNCGTMVYVMVKKI